MQKKQPITWSLVPGQEYSNRARYNIRRVMIAKGMPIKHGTESCAPKTLHNFCHGKADMTIGKLQQVAVDLNVSMATLFRRVPNDTPEL